jgi:hypothetical protein
MNELKSELNASVISLMEVNHSGFNIKTSRFE